MILTDLTSNNRSRKRWSLISSLGVLLHVLLQFSLLCVALAAVLADVSLQVLAFLVFGDVLQKRSLINKTLVAGVALVWFVSLMASGVALEI